MVKAFSLHSVGVLSALALALVSPGLRAQKEEKVLNIYNWSDYIGEEVIALTFGLSYLFDLNTTMKFE